MCDESGSVLVHFVIPVVFDNENECPEDMQLAFDVCNQHKGTGITPNWINTMDCMKLTNLTKRDVFVLNEFKGELFEKLKQLKCLVVGPRCLSCCLMDGMQIPFGPEPIFTVAMRGIYVTASGFSKAKKEGIKKKIYWMGGQYSHALTDGTTHLVSDTVLSDKYNKAAESGLKIMSVQWLEAVWTDSNVMNVSANSDRYNKYKLSIFANLKFTTSAIGKKEKQKIMNLVNENGGIFSGVFESETTNIVILNKDGVGSDKFKTAIQLEKLCLLPDWIYKSVDAGYAVDVIPYKVHAGALTSSPLSGVKLPNMSLNFSTIVNMKPGAKIIDETKSSDCSVNSNKSKDINKLSSQEMKDKETIRAIENLDINDIKKIPIFDGFCMYVKGIEGVARDRINTIVSRCGGVRYDRPSDRVTHYITTSTIYKACSSETTTAKVVSPMWLLDSISKGTALNEDDYILTDGNNKVSVFKPTKTSTKLMEPSSPMSKRNLQLLSAATAIRPPVPLFNIDTENNDDHLVNMYLKEAENIEKGNKEQRQLNQQEKQDKTATDKHLPVPNVTANSSSNTREPEISCATTEDTEGTEPIFTGLSFEVQGFDEEMTSEISSEIESEGGTVLEEGSGSDYIIVPLDYSLTDVVCNVKQACIVTVFWLRDCCNERVLVKIQYYHRAVRIPNQPILDGVVLSISTYTGLERSFLDELAKLLGAVTQLRFCRRTTSTALASTHLICPSPTGEKYAGAVKWGVPAVRASWLLACANKATRVSEKMHLVTNVDISNISEEENRGNKENVTEDRLLLNLQEEMPPPVDLPIVINKRQSLAAGSKDGTPDKRMHLNVDGEMSPASRYIAMARQGLLGSQETPKRVINQKLDNNKPDQVTTPEVSLSTPDLKSFTPTTRRRLDAVRHGEMPSGPINTPKSKYEIETPGSEFGSCMVPGSGKMSPRSRKTLWSIVNNIDSPAPTLEVRKETPVFEFCKRLMQQNTPQTNNQNKARRLDYDESESPPRKIEKTSVNMSTSRHEASPGPVENTGASISSELEQQLQQLSSVLEGRSNTPRSSLTASRLRLTLPVREEPIASEEMNGPESQANTVGWDDSSELRNAASHIVQTVAPTVRRFMLSSNVDNRDEIAQMILRLGGEVSDSTELDIDATHLLCSLPGRSEKMLGSIASGKWILHPSYIVRSNQTGMFVKEEEYEWGNDLASALPPVMGAESQLARAAHRWRQCRQNNEPGPFSAMRVVLHAPTHKRTLLARLVTAGHGITVNEIPPYTCSDATHCFVDMKRFPLDRKDLEFFASHNIPVCPAVFLTNYLVDGDTPRPHDNVIPEYKALKNS